MIDGVRGSGARIDLVFLDPAGSAFGQLLPTGRVVDDLQVRGLGSIETSIVDAGMAMVFVRAEDIGLSGLELKGEIDANPDILARLEAIRGAAAKLLGLCDRVEDAHSVTPAVPKIAFVTTPRNHTVVGGKAVRSSEIDLIARGVSMGRLHHAYEVTGSIATAAAAAIPGTIVNRAAGIELAPLLRVRIGHASGLIEVGIRKAEVGDADIDAAVLGRTSRLLMEGSAFVPASFDTKGN